MRPANPFFDTADLDAFDARTAALQDPRPHPTEPQLVQLGRALMDELLDTLLGSALEDHVTTIAETFIGGLHAGVQRLEREADRRRERLAEQLHAFDGSEVADVDLQEATRQAAALEVAVAALEFVRDSAAGAYGAATGETWSPWRGRVRRGVSAAQIDAESALRLAETRRREGADPGAHVVAFRASPRTDAPEDASRIFDALNWAQAQWPQMSLALTGAKGGERLAKRWAQQKGVRLVLARVDFERHGRAAPFRANDQLMALQPVCVLVMPETLGPAAAAHAPPFGPAMNLADQACQRGVRCVRITARPT
ncbi:MAG: pyruvate carboxylase [Phenylobacterium sp. RIFCSPHIGHO2_01_FULL_69_31]|uniref:DUF2493 domain-containing protein n=1 Tax=Phenylobacterium sp. RIFCSPHIGHO2_01_FULL_69_31 TaxID=1801944 RepID=UPI0008C002AC|nr:DUF2493 domain-containing protein [Phenylobacterium sp. RIFCSPHIGHO2_01_FULL_69_31]OHB26290.1 MAG: pyruvate carboxylase [Phenylobacterium sp. RIFCSPHIGHO2_01_FULL_69_31]